MRKKVLIVAYYWPPAGGPGVQRWMKFVKYLPEFGIEPIVYVPENPMYPIVDESLLDEIPQSVTVIKKKIFEPYGIASIFTRSGVRKLTSGVIPSEYKQTLFERLALWVRGNLFIPDARIFWVSPSVKFLRRYLDENQIDTIITTGPPHSLHLIGMKLKRMLGLRWIADFRDPWTSIGYHTALKLSMLAEEKHKKLEAEVLQQADLILVTSQSTKTEFEAVTAKPIEVITNGYDVDLACSPTPDPDFTLSHIGSLLSQRNPVILWQVLRDLVSEYPEFAARFRLRLVGTVSHDVLASIQAHDLEPYTDFVGYVSHEKAVSFQKNSQVLLLIEINSLETRSIIPGKLFEYMVSCRPVVAIGPTGSDFAGIIEETNIGVFVDYSEKEKLQEALLEYFRKYQQGALLTSAVGTERYSRRNLTERLAKLIG
jgi:hypothetical protein